MYLHVHLHQQLNSSFNFNYFSRMKRKMSTKLNNSISIVNTSENDCQSRQECNSEEKACQNLPQIKNFEVMILISIFVFLI